MPAYKSYCWSLGTTSFRMVEFNRKIERQLELLRDFGQNLLLLISNGLKMSLCRSNIIIISRRMILLKEMRRVKPKMRERRHLVSLTLG